MFFLANVFYCKFFGRNFLSISPKNKLFILIPAGYKYQPKGPFRGIQPDYTVTEAKKLKAHTGQARGAVIFLVDEADALAQSREISQMHHEDRAGVNAFIRGIDRIGNSRLPVAVIMCTNRLGALDPAIKRRAADILTFGRPTETQRHEVLTLPLKQLGFSTQQVVDIVAITGSTNGRSYGFTFSDLVQRLLPAIVLDAYPHQAINPARAIEIAQKIIPTPPFQEGAS